MELGQARGRSYRSEAWILFLWLSAMSGSAFVDGVILVGIAIVVAVALLQWLGRRR